MNLAQAVSFLGLSITPGQAALVVLEIFIAISIGLCMALILGALATDAQSLSTLMLPVMLLIMIPFFVSIFMDINTLGTAGKIFLYIIPFTHAYAALGNLMFGHTLVFWAGLAYQIVFLGILMFAAVKIFTSDLLFTMRLPTGQARGKKQRA
jgi:ABC-2 type transport system permease protein